MPCDPHVVLAGGGAPGHLSAGIAVAERLSRLMPRCRITFAGPGKAEELHRVRAAGYAYASLPASRTPERPIEAVRYAADNVLGFCAARWLVREQGVSAVIGLGGSVSTALCRAGLSRGLPVVVLERNALPERATRLLSATPATICLAYEEARPHLQMRAESLVTGAPARPSFLRLHEAHQAPQAAGPAAWRGHQRRLLVMGGVDGARSLNESVPEALAAMGPVAKDWQIVHQAGERQLQETEKRYRDAGVDAVVVTYIDEVASVCFASDLLIGRPGGTLLSEMALASLPAVLVPYAGGRADEHWANARIFEEAGAAKVVNERSPRPLAELLTQELTPLMADDRARGGMERAMQSMARPDAAGEIAAVVVGALYGRPSEALLRAA